MGTLDRGEGHRECRPPFVLVLAEMKEGVRGFRVMVEGRYHELLRAAEHGSFP